MLMLKTATVLEAISKRRRTARPAAHAGLSKNTIFAATHSAEDALVLLDATAGGLTAEHAAERLSAVGPNTIEAPTKTLARRIADAFIDPFAGILAALALVSLYIDVLAVPELQRDPSTVIVIGIMLLVSGGMKFIQEARSGNAAEALKDLVSNTCCALRDGERVEIPFDELVPGDVIRLSAGDMVPADARIITARDLFVIESALTGESEAVEKTAAITVVEGADGSALPLSACKNIVFTGTSVQNGTAMALVVATGSDTYLGGIAKMLNGRGEKSAFDRGVSSVSMLLVRLMLVMAPAVFAINAATKGNVIDALLFATSVAVGITPQMLPVIVTTSLSQGAKDLARRQVIVKELPAIQNLGAMDVLCCDKTGTLTEDRIVLERYLNTDGNEDARVLRHAFLNSFFQTGLKNLIDLAVIDRADVTPSAAAPDSMLGQSLRDRYTKVDEVPFDFSRRRLSVVVADAQGKTQMVTKGAAEEMLEICSFVEVDGAAQPLTEDKLAQIRQQVAGLNAEGLRVIAVAQKTNPRCVGEFGIADECDMVLMGFLAFLDPPKASAVGAIATLEAKGVAVKVLTGDNDRVAATVCEQIGIDASNVLLGSEIDALDDAELAERAENTPPLRQALAAAEGASGACHARAARPHRGLYGRWHQRRRRHACKRLRHLGRFGRRHCQGICRYHLAPEGPGRARARHHRRPPHLRQPTQVPQDHGELQLWQRAIRDRREPVLAVLAHERSAVGAAVAGLRDRVHRAAVGHRRRRLDRPSARLGCRVH